jgi:hypothetical protein
MVANVYSLVGCYYLAIQVLHSYPQIEVGELCDERI